MAQTDHYLIPQNAKNYALWESREYESYGDSNVEGAVNTPECLPTTSNITLVENIELEAVVVGYYANVSEIHSTMGQISN